MDEGRDATFSDVGVDARPCAEAINAEVKQGHCGLCCGEEGCVISIPYAGDIVGCGHVVTDFVAFDPSGDGLSAEVKEERRERVALEGASLYPDGWGGAVWSEEDSSSRGVEVADEGDEVRWKAKEGKGAGKEAVVL